eukprot:COSAG02_NODE_1705_length_11236_cov_6.168178_4_plen_51_part_00
MRTLQNTLRSDCDPDLERCASYKSEIDAAVSVIRRRQCNAICNSSGKLKF